jgi:hypothetical protein
MIFHYWNSTVSLELKLLGKVKKTLEKGFPYRYSQGKICRAELDEKANVP